MCVIAPVQRQAARRASTTARRALHAINLADAKACARLPSSLARLLPSLACGRCYDRPTLYSFAKHYQTGEPLPEEMFRRLKAAKTFRSGTMMLRQVRARAGGRPGVCCFMCGGFGRCCSRSALGSMVRPYASGCIASW